MRLEVTKIVKEKAVSVQQEARKLFRKVEDLLISTQTWLDQKFPDFIRKDEWPAASPYLNPLDYSIWSIIQNTVNAQAFILVESLKQAPTEAVNNLDQVNINKAIDDWPRRLDAGDRHFE
jgi:Txe/YoeB family toxin of Txe-Axe toxin-antitoxin module